VTTIKGSLIGTTATLEFQTNTIGEYVPWSSQSGKLEVVFSDGGSHATVREAPVDKDVSYYEAERESLDPATAR
jgi:hypothetical protein